MPFFPLILKIPPVTSLSFASFHLLFISSFWSGWFIFADSVSSRLYIISYLLQSGSSPFQLFWPRLRHLQVLPAEWKLPMLPWLLSCLSFCFLYLPWCFTITLICFVISWHLSFSPTASRHQRHHFFVLIFSFLSKLPLSPSVPPNVVWTSSSALFVWTFPPSSTFPILKLIPFSRMKYHHQALLLLSCREFTWLQTSSFLNGPSLLLGCFCASSGQHISAWGTVSMRFQCCVSVLSHCCLQHKEGSNEEHVWEVSAIPCG